MDGRPERPERPHPGRRAPDRVRDPARVRPGVVGTVHGVLERFAGSGKNDLGRRVVQCHLDGSLDVRIVTKFLTDVFRGFRVHSQESRHASVDPVGGFADLVERIVGIAAGPVEQPPDGFHFTVIGYIGGRSKRKNDDYLAERRTAHAQGQRRAGRTAVPVSIELPEAPSIGHPQVELERLNWELEVTAEVDGKPDYEASFDLPVTTEVPDPEPELDTASAPPADPRDDTVNKDEDHSEREPAADEKDDTGEDAYWAVDEDGTETRLRSSESEAPETVTDRASNEKGSARTRSGSSVKNRLVLLGSGGLSLAAGLALIFMDEPELVRVLCGLGMALFGGLLVYGGLTGS